jgi:tetratricopeptide (TPR) repeat protein
MYCQVCRTLNPDDEDHCRQCQHRLLVLSGFRHEDEETLESDSEEGFSFDEHLLERISILEEVLKRTGETLRTVLSALRRQEENVLINHAGLSTVRELLEQRGLVDAEEWTDRWETKLDAQVLALEKRDRFSALKDRVAALYSGDKRDLFRRLLDEAEYSLAAFRVEKALDTLERALKLDPKNYDLAHFLGESLFHEGELDAALGHFERVLGAKADHYEGLVYSGVIHHQRGRAREAERLLLRAVEVYPRAFLPHFCLGATYAGSGELEKAVSSLERAVAIDPVAQALYLLGSCLYEMGKLKPAIDVLSKAVRVDPLFEECFHLLGLCYLDRHWNRKALEAFRHAQELNPKRMRYEDLVAYLTGSGEAVLPPIGAAALRWTRQADELLRRGEDRDAVKCYRQALREEPNNPGLLMSFALACLHLNRSQELHAITQRVIDLDPGEMLKTTAYATMIAALRGEGKFREGNRLGARLLDEGGSDFSKAIAYYEMAYNLAEMDEDLDQALDFARRSLEYSPDELKQFPLAALGWVHYKRREFDQAINFLTKSTELGATATTMTHLGMALLASGEQEGAKSILDRARLMGQGDAVLGEKMMELMRDSARLLEGVRKRG